MADIARRTTLRLIAAVPLAAAFEPTLLQSQEAQEHAAKAVDAAARGKTYQPKFFTPREWAVVGVLVDLIIPKDERSGSATEAGVPEFMDFLMTDPADDDQTRERRQVAMRGGLAWIDAECRRRFQHGFLECTDAQRRQLLDEIAYAKDGQEHDEDDGMLDHEHGLPPAAGARHGSSFFHAFRDLTASGFWSSKMGIDDLRYVGNTATAWEGPPAEVLRTLGLDE